MRPLAHPLAPDATRHKARQSRSRVRITVEGSSWGLALDEPTGGDSVFSCREVKIVVGSDLAGVRCLALRVSKPFQ